MSALSDLTDASTLLATNVAALTPVVQQAADAIKAGGATGTPDSAIIPITAAVTTAATAVAAAITQLTAALTPTPAP